MDNQFFKKAKKVLGKEPDIIVDAYDLTIKYVSNKHLKITGHKKEDIIGVYSKEFVDGLSEKEINRVLVNLIIKGKSKFKVNVKKKNGGWVKEELYAELLLNGITPMAVIKSKVIK